MKYKIPTTTTAVIGALALLATGCEHYRTTRTMTAPAATTATQTACPGAPGYVVSKTVATPSKAQAALKRARDYYAQLSAREKAKLQKRGVYYFAVEVPGYRNRGMGVPVLLYDIRANKLVNNRIIFINTPIKARQVFNLPREVTTMPGCKCQFIEYIGVGAPVAYP